jgi:hypothetical protein
MESELAKLETLFHALLDIPGGTEREAAAIRLSGGDLDLARRALHLVASGEKAEAANQMARHATMAPAPQPLIHRDSSRECESYL